MESTIQKLINEHRLIPMRYKLSVSNTHNVEIDYYALSDLCFWLARQHRGVQGEIIRTDDQHQIFLTTRITANYYRLDPTAENSYGSRVDSKGQWFVELSNLDPPDNAMINAALERFQKFIANYTPVGDAIVRRDTSWLYQFPIDAKLLMPFIALQWLARKQIEIVDPIVQRRILDQQIQNPQTCFVHTDTYPLNADLMVPVSGKPDIWAIVYVEPVFYEVYEKPSGP